jgi:integrase
MAAREEALAQKTPPIGSAATVAGTVNAAIIGYYASTQWNDELSNGSRDVRRPILEKFREDHGDKRFANMHATAIANILNKKTAHAQRNFRKAVRHLVKWAIKHGLIKVDPFATVELSKPRKQRGRFRGHIPWTDAECEQFELRHAIGTKERLAYELLLQAGQSMCDVIRLGRQHVRKGTISLSRQKTGVPFYVKVNEELAAAIDAMPRSNSLTFLINHTTLEPFTPDAFAKWFRKACDVAGLPRKDPETGKPRCTSHGLRKFAASRLASRGGTTTELKAMFGWKTSSEADLSTEAADRERAATNAAEKLTSNKKRTTLGNLGKGVAQNRKKTLT